jgi:hypothetical protein
VKIYFEKVFVSLGVPLRKTGGYILAQTFTGFANFAPVRAYHSPPNENFHQPVVI